MAWKEMLRRRDKQSPLDTETAAVVHSNVMMVLAAFAVGRYVDRGRSLEQRLVVRIGTSASHQKFRQGYPADLLLHWKTTRLRGWLERETKGGGPA